MTEQGEDDGQEKRNVSRETGDVQQPPDGPIAPTLEVQTPPGTAPCMMLVVFADVDGLRAQTAFFAQPVVVGERVFNVRAEDILKVAAMAIDQSATKVLYARRKGLVVVPS